MGSGREDDHSPPSNVEFKKAWSCTSTLPYAFISSTETTLPHMCVSAGFSLRLENTEIQTGCLYTNWTHKTAGPYGHRSRTKVLFNLSNSTTNTVCPLTGNSAPRPTVTVNPKQIAGKQMTAIHPDLLTDRSVHDLYLYNGKTGRPQGRLY